MRPWLKRAGFRAFLVAFLPFFFVAVVLAAPRMLIDWQLRRDWLEDFGMFFKKRTYIDLLQAMRTGSTI